MIELPRAALRAQEIAESADFFSFGTNDLTQTTFGISRDDAAGFIGAYQEKGLIEKDPFATLDTEGVGVLVRVARQRRPQGEAGPEARHLRRARRRPRLDPLLRRGRPRLRLLLALPRADRPPRRGAGGARQRPGLDGLVSAQPSSVIPVCREAARPATHNLRSMQIGHRRSPVPRVHLSSWLPDLRYAPSGMTGVDG